MSSSSSADANLQARASQQAALADLGRRALDLDDLGTLFSDAASAVVETLDTEYAGVFELLPDREAAVLTHGVGWASGLDGTAAVSAEPASLVGYTLQRAEPVVVEALDADDRFSGSGLLSNHDVESGIAVAIGPPAEPWGVLSTYASEPHPFTDQDAEFVEQVAALLNSAIENDATVADLEAEQTLQQQVTRTNSLGIAVVDADGDLEYANDRAETMLGESQSELEWLTGGADDLELIDADGAPLPEDDRPLERVLTERERVSDLEFGVRSPDDDPVWLSLNGTPLGTDEAETDEESGDGEADGDETKRDGVASREGAPSDATSERAASGDGSEGPATGETSDDGRDDSGLRGAVFSFEDVTEQRERERELEARSAAMEQSIDGMAILDADQEFVFANQAHADVYGYDGPETFVGETWRLCYGDEEAERLEAEALSELQATGSWRGEAVGRCADGDTFPQELSLTTLDDGRYVCVVRDVTDRTERERELERYERIVENLPVGVYRNTPGPDGEFVEMNETLADIFHADSVEELLACDVSDLYTDPRERAAFSRTLEHEGSVRNVELQQETLEGDTIWISVTGMQTEEDGEVYFDGVVQDITEERRRREQIERQEAALRETYEVIADRERSFEEKVQALLDLGREHLGTEYASLSDVEGEEYRFEAVSGIEDVEPGDVVPLSATNCERAIATEQTLVLEDVASDAPDFADRAGNVEWGISSYLGAPVYTEDDVSGTLCFYGDEPRSQPFSEWELTMVELWSQWISYELDRTEHQQQLEQYRSLTEAANDVIVTIDAESTIQNVNPAVEEIFGYEPEALVGESLTTLMSDDMAARHREALAQYLGTGERTLDWDYVEVPGVHADGHNVPLSITFSQVEYGGETYFTGVVRDVTEREHREQLLEERERQLSNLIDNVPGMVYRCRNERGWPMEFVSDVSAELTGYAPDAFEAGDVSWGEDVIALEEDRELLWETVQEEARESEGTFSATYRIETADGEQRWVRDYGRGIYDEDGALVEIEGIISDVTERRRLESELEEVFGRVTDAFYALDDQWRFTHVNDRAEELLQRSESELLGEELWELFPEAAEKTEVWDAFHEAMETQEPRSYETHFQPLGFWVEATVYPSKSGVSVYFRDVTERKERERELERKERRYQATFEDPNILVGLLEPDGTVLDINETAMEYVDADLADVTGEPFWETPWWDGDDVGDAVREWTERAADGEYVDFEADLTRPDGQRYTLSGYFRPVTNEDGDVVSIIVSDRDVTERKERERELEESERRYRTLVENFPNGAVGLVDENLRYQTVGGRPTDVADATAEEIEGKKVRDAVPAVIADELAPSYRAAIDEGESSSFEVETNGRVYQFQVVPVRDEDGEVFAALGMSQDVTQRTEYERRLAESERRYRTLADYFPKGIVTLFDHDLVYTLAAGQGFEFIDAEPADLEGHSFDEAWDEETAEALEPLFEAALAGEEKTVEMEYAGREWRIQAVPITDERGDVFAGMTMAQDITEQKERERYLEDAKSQLEAATEAGAVGTWEWDVHADEFVASSTFAETFGLDPDAVREGAPLSDLVDSIHEDDRERVEEQIEEALDTCGEYEAEYRVRNAADEVRWVVARGRVECDEDGTPVSFPGALTDVTERKEYQRRLEESERRYRTLVEHFPNGAVGMFDRDLEYTAVGGQLLDEDDYPSDERLGNSVYDIYPDELVSELEPHFEAALDGASSTFEVERGGRLLSAHTLPVRDADDEVFAGMLVVQDVTEQREKEEQLREREQRLERYKQYTDDVLDAIDDVFYIVDENGQLQRWNESLSDVTGYPSEEIAEMNALEFFDEENQTAVAEAIRDGFQTGQTQVEAEFLTTDGEQIPFEFAASTLEDPSGNRVLAGIGRDITERRDHRRQLEESERRYRTLAEHFPNGAVGVYDAELRYTLAAGAKLGEELPAAKQLEGERMPDIFPEATAADLEPIFRAAVEDGETGNTDTEFGGRHWRVWAAPLLDADGEIFAGLSFAQDITQQIEREERLEELVERLEASNERLEQFAYAASHDLQEPLRMVSSYLTLIERRYADALDEDGQEFIDYAVDGADRMRDMIEALLEYSRVETRGDPFEPVDLTDVFEDARQDLGMRIEETDAEITVEELPTVEGDPDQLGQVFQNLLKNGIEYSGDGPPRIHVSAERRRDEWLLTVRDEGIGIDPNQADRIFQVFQRLHSHDDHPGTGIGLALTRRIVERHGGEIWVDSTPGEGSTFSFALPVRGTDDE